MAGELAPLQSAIPIVANASDRETRYPPASRIQNQRVFRIDTQNQERWTGSSWIIDFLGGPNASPELAGIPVVANQAARDTAYPTPTTNQRVFRLDTLNVERWSGSAWVIDGQYVSPPGGSRTVTNTTTYLANNAVFNVKDFGAKGDRVTDDTVAIQATITAAQAYIPSINVYMPQSPVVFLPAGEYSTTASLLITAPIRVMGSGAQQSVLYPTTPNLPCLIIDLPVAQSTYIVFEVDHVGIVGLNPFSNYSTQDLADGIQVTGVSDVTSHIHDVRIVSMTGHGVNLAKFGNSNKIIDCVIEQCCKDGIHIDGQYNTDFWIERCFIRENRRGIAIQNTTGLGSGYLTTGRILNTLLESNNGGTTGTIGSTDRPSMGVFMSKVQWVLCAGNYSENHWNDWFLNDNVSFCTFRENTFLISNSLNLVQTYGGPPANKAGFYVGSGVNSYNNVVGNVFGTQPIQPGGVSNTNWGTGTFGASYEHVTDTVGVNRYLYNITNIPGNGTVLITNPANRHTILNAVVDTTDGAGRAIQHLQAYKSQDDFANMSIVRTANQITYQGLNAGAGLLETITFPSGTLTNQAFFQGQAGPAGALSNYLVVDPNGVVNLRFSDGGGNKYLWTYAAAAPTTGAHVVGEVVLNNAPTSGGFIGFVCTTAGTPGTWKTFGAIS